MKRTDDPTEYEGEVGDGTDAKQTQMLKGKGKFSSAQLADNNTQPFNTGKAPAESGSGMARHPGNASSLK